MALTFGPSTSNAALAKALGDFLTRQAQALAQDDYELLTEAADRIEERGDDGD